jgi:hypothetical protein
MDVQLWSKDPISGEPVFTLMGRDPQAPGLLHMWATERLAGIDDGRFPVEDREVAQAVIKLAGEMKEWREKNDGAWRADNPELPLDDRCHCEWCKRDGQHAPSCGTHNGPEAATTICSCGLWARNRRLQQARILPDNIEVCDDGSFMFRSAPPRTFDPKFEIFPGSDNLYTRTSGK